MCSWIASLAFSDKRGKGPALEECKMCAGFSFSVFVCFSCVCYKWGCPKTPVEPALPEDSEHEREESWLMKYDGQDYRKHNIFLTVSSTQSSLFLPADFSYLELGRSIADVKRNILSFLLPLESDKNQMYFFFSPKVFLIICIQIPLLFHSLKVWLQQVWHTLQWTNWELTFDNMVLWK